MKKVSVIVLCWNHCEDVTVPFMENFLKTVNFKDENVELILLNNGSKDKTKQFLDTFEFDDVIKVIHSPTNLGFSGGNNEALKSVTGDYILFMNNDVVMKEPGWISKLVAEADEKTVVGADLVTGNSATEFRGKMREYLNGWCVMFPRQFLDSYGGFSEEFGHAYFEDVELSQRAVLAGLKLKKVEVPLVHLGSRSSDQLDMSEQSIFNSIVYKNLMYKHEKKDKLRIVFFCPGNYEFLPEDYWGKGVGGAESSLILLAEELGKLGHIVEVYNNTKLQSKYGNVYYYNILNYRPSEYADVFVLFRNSDYALRRAHAGVKIFWSCDQHTTNDWPEKIIPFVDKTIAISEYHRDFLLSHYPFNKKDVISLDLGINKEDYDVSPLPGKVPGKLIFCSVPRRGLKHLADLFPKIKAKVPFATLTITSDYRLWGAEPENSEFLAMFESMSGVEYCGKIERKELVRHQLEAEVMAYPCDYDENFCISAMECIAAGAIPVTSTIGALPTTVAESGILINEKPGGMKFSEAFIENVCKLLTDKDYSNELRKSGQIRSMENYSWKHLAKAQWLSTFQDLLNMTKPKNNYCNDCDIQFENAFEFFKHRSQKHDVKKDQHGFVAEIPQDLYVLIKTTKPTELSIGSEFWKLGTEHRVKQHMSADIVRVLTEAYGQGIVENVEIVS